MMLCFMLMAPAAGVIKVRGGPCTHKPELMEMCCLEWSEDVSCTQGSLFRHSTITLHASSQLLSDGSKA